MRAMRAASFGLAALAMVLASCSGFGKPADLTPSATARQLARNSFGGGKIQHVVVIVQENRSFDNFFDCFPGTDCVKHAPGPGPQPGPTTSASPCPVLSSPSPGPTPTPIKLKFGAPLYSYDPGHTYCPSFVTEYDGGRMDGFYWVDGLPKGSGGVPPTYPYRVVAEKQIQPYWDLASQYVLADRAFPTEASGSFTAHQDLIRGDTAVTFHHQQASLVDLPWNAGQHKVNNWGCDDPKQGMPNGPSYTPLLTPSLQYIREGPFPCFTYPTLRDRLDAKAVSWKYYVPVFPNNGGQMWNAFDAIKSVRYGKTEWPHKEAPWNCTGSCVSWPETNVLCDVAGSTNGSCPAPNPSGPVSLPQVSWVIPNGVNSDHYDGNGTDGGPDWVGCVVNTIGESSYWNSTAIVILWDDWGGWYDHVPPPSLDYTGLGFRVPFIVVSPYAKKGYVSHTQYEFGSVLKFIESTFGLHALGTTDSRANNLDDAFDFTQSPRAFVPINLLHQKDQKHCSQYFLSQPRSSIPVDTE
jgi:phospholipase C